MIEFFSSWAKGIGVTVVIISIIEMLLPNNNSKKYIRMVLGIYLIFNIVSPLIKNKDILNVNNINLNETTISTSSEEVDQTSMNKRIKKIYEQELEKDITKKKVSIDKTIDTNKTEEKNTESKIVAEIQKIKKIDTNIGEDKHENEKQDNKNIDKSDIQNIKKFLIDEYGVNENCLEIS